VIDDSNNLQCAHLLSAMDVPADLIKFLFIVGRKNQNDLFETCWGQHCNLFNTLWRQQHDVNDLPSFTAVYEAVCKPVIKECEKILVSLEQRSITLEEVEKRFWKFEMPELKQHLLKLCQGIRECFPTNESISAGKNWIPLVVDDIQVYKRISGYMNTANIILKLKNSMKLDGDFSAVNTLAKQVCFE